VVGISTDSVDTLRRFKASINAPFPLLSDPGGRVSRLYSGVSGGTANRVTVTIDAYGNIVHVTQGIDALLPNPDACPSGKQMI
jgi:peroxiredoxin Q/BCP